MANTKTVTTLEASVRKVVIQYTLTSDGTQETNAVVYSSSTQSAAIKDISGAAYADPKKSTLYRVIYSNNSVAGVIKLNFDATTPVLAVPIPKSYSDEFDFSSVGGLRDYAGSGITGDITLTTTGLASGEALTLVLEILPY